jgi:hypothetical protein
MVKPHIRHLQELFVATVVERRVSIRVMYAACHWSNALNGQ